MTDLDEKVARHGEEIVQLKSDVFHITTLLSGEYHAKLDRMETGIDDIKRLLGAGDVQFQSLTDADAALGLRIDAIVETNRRRREASLGRRWYLVYPLILAAGVTIVELIKCAFAKH